MEYNRTYFDRQCDVVNHITFAAPKDIAGMDRATV